MRSSLAALAVFGLAVTACGGSAPAPQHRPTVSHPAATPRRAAQPAPQPLSAGQIAARMGKHHVTVYTASSDPNHLLGRHGGYSSKAAWGVTTAGFAGSIEVYPTAAGAAARTAYLANFICPIGDGYDYRSGRALLRLSCSLTPSQAHRAKAAFDAALSG